MTTAPTKLKAADEVLLAAADLSREKKGGEFTEWDLTVRAWELNTQRWGLRGHEDHPDHKRVMMETMGKDGLVRQGFLRKTKPNHYRVTEAGALHAATISKPRDSGDRRVDLFEAIEDFAFHRVFESYLESNGVEPRTWLSAAAFLKLPRNDPDLLETQLKTIRQGTRNAIAFVQEKGMTELPRGDQRKGLTLERLRLLESFMDDLEKRFEPQIAAIRKRKR